MRIQVLSPQLANQIAAGEVIERPASVLKELLENSLDAAANHIKIDIEKGGLQLIKVQDDGYGITAEDLPLALARHATSKIKTLPDLEAIRSLGFRGEALASISSVARLLLTSNTANQEHAWSVTASGRDMTIKVLPAAHPVGTSVEVRDLFFNTPARRKFLATEKTEFSHIEIIAKQIALSDFSKSLVLTHNQREIFNLRTAQEKSLQEKRITKICGSEFMRNAVRIDMEATGLRLYGWVALPNFSLSHSHLQYFYVNQRIVRDKVINHAIRQAFFDQLPQGRFAAYVLYLELEPSSIDVNVHPTKHEVRFHQARLIHDFIVNSLMQAFNRSVVTTVNSANALASNTLLREPRPDYQATAPASSVENKTASYFGKLLLMIENHFLVTTTSRGLAIIDTQKAYATIVATTLLQEYQSQSIKTLPLLIPKSLALTPILLTSFTKINSVFTQLGFDIVDFPGQKLIIRKIPVALKNSQLDELIFECLKYFTRHTHENMEIVEFISILLSALKFNLTNDQQAQDFLKELEALYAVYPVINFKSFMWHITYNDLQQHFMKA